MTGSLVMFRRGGEPRGGALGAVGGPGSLGHGGGKRRDKKKRNARGAGGLEAQAGIDVDGE